MDLPGFFILWTKHKNVYPQIYYLVKIGNQYFMVKIFDELMQVSGQLIDMK